MLSHYTHGLAPENFLTANRIWSVYWWLICEKLTLRTHKQVITSTDLFINILFPGTETCVAWKYQEIIYTHTSCIEKSVLFSILKHQQLLSHNGKINVKGYNMKSCCFQKMGMLFVSMSALYFCLALLSVLKFVHILLTHY